MPQNSAPCSPGLVAPVVLVAEPGFAREIWHTALPKATEAQKDSKSLAWSGRLSLPSGGVAHFTCPHSPPQLLHPAHHA